MAEVEISYKGSNIATMNASGTKTLLTEAKYLEDDVTVTYTRPAAPSGTKNISITANGTTTEDVTNYANAQITANVPNTYAAADDGKVVSNGALVAQGSDTVTQNDTYDTTLISSLTVNVSGGGGYTLKEELFGYSPAGDVYYVPDENIPGRGIMGKRGITKLTLDFKNGYAFNNPASNGYNFTYNNIQKYVIIGYDYSTKVTLPPYCFTANATRHLIVLRGIVRLQSTSNQNIFRADTGLELLDFTYTGGSGFQQNAFYDDSNFKTLILRGDSVVPLNNTNAFTHSTPFASGGSGGTLYVPADLITSYQGASNWSTILGYTNNQIKSIESTHTDPNAPFDMTLYYADGTPISA